MPIRIVIVLLSLFAACLAVALGAWAAGSEFYLFIPGRRGIHRPPDHPIELIIAMAFCAGLFLLFSQHYGLVFFTGLFASLVLGSIVGYLVFAWTPTVVQWLLTVAMGAETTYGWMIHGEYLEY